MAPSDGLSTTFCTTLYTFPLLKTPYSINIWHILCCALSLVLILLALCIFQRNEGISTKNSQLNKNLLLPLYQRLLSLYALSLTFTLCVWTLELLFTDCFAAWWMSALCSLQMTTQRGFLLFVALFISRRSSSNTCETK